MLAEIGEGLAQHGGEVPHAILVGRCTGVWRCTGLGRVVNEVVGEEFVEDGEVSTAPDLLGVAAHHRLGEASVTKRLMEYNSASAMLAVTIEGGMS